MKLKFTFAKLIPLVTVFVAISSCGTSEEQEYFSPYRLNSQGVSDIYNNEATKLESNPIDKTKLDYTYTDLLNNYVYRADNIPSLTGTDARMLVIPVWFKDSDDLLFPKVNEEEKSNKKEAIRNDIKNAFFGSEIDTGWRSVSGYYKQESFNKFNLTGSVTEWYECGKSFYDYCLVDDASTSQNNTANLVKEAFEWFKKNNSDSASFDSDKDGYIDAVALIYGAPDYETYKNVNSKIIGSNMWAYSYWIQDNPDVKNPKVNSYLWASYDFMYDKSNPRYSYYGYGDARYYKDREHCKLDTHTFIHETGHLLGLQDYYDYATSYGYVNAYSPAGYFSMQDNNIGGHDPFSKIALGWNKPYVVDGNTFEDEITLTIRPNQETGDVILLTNEFSGSPFDEYLLIELYTPTGLNEFDTKYAYLKNSKYQGPKESGCRLWHVDARLASPVSTTGRGSSKAYIYEPADQLVITNNPTQKTQYGLEHAATNTTKHANTKGYYSEVPGFSDYRLLQLIRQDKKNYRCNDSLNSKNLFKEGDKFSTYTYATAFVNTGRFDNGSSFNFVISFDSVTSESATITIKKISTELFPWF